MKDYMKELANSEYANAVKSIYDGIKEATNIAAKESIKANTVFISNRFAKIKEHIREQRFNDGISKYEYELDVPLPPMICGLEAYFTDELPEEFAFAVTESPSGTEYQRLKNENKRLIEQLEQIKSILGWEE